MQNNEVNTGELHGFPENEEMGTSPPRTLEEIAGEIKKCQDRSDESCLQIGRLLWKAKGQFGKYGEWLDWLRENVELSICKVQRLMRIAKWVDSNEAPVPYLEYTKAYALSRLSGKDLTAFLDKHDVKSMSKKDVEKAVREYLRGKAGASSNNAVTTQRQATVSTEENLRRQSEKIRNNVTKLVDLVRLNSGEYKDIITELRDFIDDTLSMEAD